MMIVQAAVDAFSMVQDKLFESVVQPVMFAAGMGEYLEDAFDGTEWFLVGVCELMFLFILLRPLEALIPVHKFDDPRARWNDFIYTALHRLGVFSIVVFFLLDPLFAQLSDWLHIRGWGTFNLDEIWPGVTEQPLVAFLLYLVALDFFEYWYHRAQHGLRWMWALHSLHHSQRNMNLWSDDRAHILDDLLHDVLIGVLALAIGVQPAQFILLISVSRMLQSLQHANVRLHFGRLGERLLVSPRFHRMHHAIGVGHESHGKGSLGGHNFAVLLPVWDVLFRTARFGGDFHRGFGRTGVRDQLPEPAGKGRDYGSGFWAQQWLGVQRLIRAARRSES